MLKASPIGYRAILAVISHINFGFERMASGNFLMNVNAQAGRRGWRTESLVHGKFAYDDVLAPRHVGAHYLLDEVIGRREADVQGRRCADRSLRIVTCHSYRIRFRLSGDPAGLADSTAMRDVGLDDG